jgi:hypothetical protein
MESHRPQKNQEAEGLPDGQMPRPRRFRIIKLEERIAPKKGGGGKITNAGHCKDTWACTGTCDVGCCVDFTDW